MPVIRQFLLPFLGVLVSSLCAAERDESIPFPGGDISVASAQDRDGMWTLSTSAVSASFALSDGKLRLARLENHLTRETQAWERYPLFVIHLNGKALPAAEMKLADGPKRIELTGNPKLARLSERLNGVALTAVFQDAATGLRVCWSAELRDGSNYLRQKLELTTTKAVTVSDIEMIRVQQPDAKLAGYTDGSPVTAGNWFMGVEHPMARTAVSESGGWGPAEMAARCFTRSVVNLKPGPLTARFDYKSGNHRIDVVNVELVANGKTLAEDAHAGFSGHAVSNNVYTLKVPEGVDSAELRITLGGQPQETNSYGSITVTGGELGGGKTVTSALPRQFSLEPCKTWFVSSQVGAAPAGQLRRAFAYYLQRERAHPYRQYWHYNSWYDLNIGRNDNPDPLKRMNEDVCLKVVEAFHQELFQKRGVGLNGFVWDDGWDDWNSLWKFHKGFPNGFVKLGELAKKQGAGMGAWLSPWGGYGQSHAMRVKLGREQGYETNSAGFSLGGPKYFAAFRDSCTGMIRDCGMNYFKFDGIGGGMFATGAPLGIAADLDGLVRLIGELRRENPDVFINCTVGTWASPYWMHFADSIWRQGEDSAFGGKGNMREQWINYKDSLVYDRFVSRSPFFPLNSLMYHGVLLGPTQNPGRMPPPAKDLASFQHEVRMAAGYASGLGELYITPALMTPEAWDCLAECIQWARARKAIVVDAHWIGGDPRKNEVYGFAAWHPKQGGVLTLRNPDDKPQSIALKLADAFEFLPGVDAGLELRSPWKSESSRPSVKAQAQTPQTFTLQPFEVLTLETLPAR